MHTHTHVHICTHAHMHTHMHTYMHTGVYAPRPPYPMLSASMYTMCGLLLGLFGATVMASHETETRQRHSAKLRNRAAISAISAMYARNQSEECKFPALLSDPIKIENFRIQMSTIG